jgi:serine/threonine protein kinase
MATPSNAEDRSPAAEEFLRHVLRSRLLARDELQAALRGVPRDRRDDAGALADHLVRAGKLTRFQSSKLLKGASGGLIIGPFRILTPLGKGGMGTVFLVRDQRSNQLAALKILPPRLAREERMLARFRREMDLSRKVAHPHLAWTFEVGEHHGVQYLAMEFVPGRTLTRLVRDEGVMHWKRAARVMAEVAAALQHAHEQGVIHRDLKPSNVMITPNDHAKVLDLGLAMTHGEVVEDARVVGGQGYIVGSMDYIAPEQTLDAAKVDGRCDLYALGCTLYFALSGRQPFPGGTSKEKIQRHRTEQPTPISELVPGLPVGFVGLVEGLMCKDPSGRPPTAQLAEMELRMWATGEEEPPPDAAPGTGFDWQSLAETEAEGSGEFGLVPLPEVEVLDEGARSRWPTWPVILLAASAAVMLLGALLLALGMLAGR